MKGKVALLLVALAAAADDAELGAAAHLGEEGDAPLLRAGQSK